MRMPISPPTTGDDASSRFWQQLEATLLPLEVGYLHWDQLCEKIIPIQNVSHKQWWQLLKAKRRARRQQLPFVDQKGKPFYWVFDDHLIKRLSQIDRLFALRLSPVTLNTQRHTTFIQETISLTQLAQINVTTEVAHELLCSGRPAANKTEQIVLNHFAVLTSLPINVDLTIHALNKIIAQLSGNEILPILTSQQQQRLQQILDFANQEADEFVCFMHPVLKAVILHFMVVNDEAFGELSPSIASLIFYWQLLTAGYMAMQVISISQQMQQYFTDYQRSFLLTYTDDNDLTYVIMQQLNHLFAAINGFCQQVEKVNLPITVENNQLNTRQRLILAEMQRYPEYQYRIAAMQRRFNTTYETARTDLMGLVKDGLVKQGKIGKAFVYQALRV